MWSQGYPKEQRGMALEGPEFGNHFTLSLHPREVKIFINCDKEGKLLFQTQHIPLPFSLRVFVILEPKGQFHALSNLQTWIFRALQSHIPQKLLSSWLGSYQAAVGITRGQLKGKINNNRDLHQNIFVQLAPRAGGLLQSWVLQGGLQLPKPARM